MHFERVGTLVNINMFDSPLHRHTKLEYEPSLATSWKALNDTTWEFKLRKGVKFHNGDPLTAEDVKFSVERVTEPGKEKSTLQVAQPILQEAALSFLGVGSGRTYPTWGQMIALGATS